MGLSDTICQRWEVPKLPFAAVSPLSLCTSGHSKAILSLNIDFNLEKERIVLDEQGIRIAENQENSQKNRRKLAESTRDFKKASAEEKLSLFNSLLKGYQEEVDNLTKRANLEKMHFLTFIRNFTRLQIRIQFLLQLL
ncbi:CCAAT-displacement protein alternatively spliced product [Actinidia rufa]|uniref:CCAAT-displacement protein alternatively spliced product n=1 Tax=Actinidia rufa TaxID=165716 RepID=A0A7J0DDR5_9ERIC|nr:CCAAT-displacement protein alternatively spliced product [Actinidia rufa]